jgi:hypothetical protein
VNVLETTGSRCLGDEDGRAVTVRPDGSLTADFSGELS